VNKGYGGHSAGETPGPIPNPEAKTRSADGTAPGRVWESRSPPDTTTTEEGHRQRRRRPSPHLTTPPIQRPTAPCHPGCRHRPPAHHNRPSPGHGPLHHSGSRRTPRPEPPPFNGPLSEPVDGVLPGPGRPVFIPWRSALRPFPGRGRNRGKETAGSTARTQKFPDGRTARHGSPGPLTAHTAYVAGIHATARPDGGRRTAGQTGPGHPLCGCRSVGR
jgi:hypothetical protein